MGSAGNVVLAVQYRANVLVQSMQTFYKEGGREEEAATGST